MDPHSDCWPFLTHREQAKNSNAGVGERLSAAGSAVGDKFDEQSAEAKKEGEFISRL